MSWLQTLQISVFCWHTKGSVRDFHKLNRPPVGFGFTRFHLQVVPFGFKCRWSWCFAYPQCVTVPRLRVCMVSTAYPIPPPAWGSVQEHSSATVHTGNLCGSRNGRVASESRTQEELRFCVNPLAHSLRFICLLLLIQEQGTTDPH